MSNPDSAAGGSPPLDSDDFARLDAVFADVVDLEPESRARALEHECRDRPDLRRELEALLSAHDRLARDGDADNEQAVQGIGFGTRVGAYRLLDKIGEGGMGEVFRAERADGVFAQQVAVKITRSTIGHRALLRRFQVERQILATLNHANIVRLLDGGATATGQAYLIMEHVEGVPVTHYCRAHALSLEKRLHIFRVVCEAVQYAHAHAVVHRDLKPANILVGSNEVPKVVDFGIAKLLEGPGVTGFTTRSVMPGPLTPNYASPEQLRGLPVTTVSDVYALGVLLYELVAGVRPYETQGQTLDRVVDIVVKTDPPRPSAAAGEGSTLPYSRARIAGDLDAIVLKAMSKRPSDRYASAGELGTDITRLLVGHPVLARAPSPAYVLRRLAGRHKTLVAVSAMALLFILATSGVALWQWQVARVAQARAEQRFREVRSIANTLLFELHDTIADVAGATTARELLLRRGVEYLDRLASESSGDPDLTDELARSYVRLAALQGATFYWPHVATASGPETILSKAVKLAEANHAAWPEDPRFGRTLSAAYRAFGRLDQKRFRPEAREWLRRSLEVAELSFHPHTGDLDQRDNLIDAHLAWGLYLHMHAPLAEAEAQYRTALTLATDALPSWQADPRAAASEELSASWLKWVLAHEERWAEALELAERELAVAKRRLAANPDSADARRSVAIGEHNVGWTLLGLGKAREALPRLEAALYGHEAQAAGERNNRVPAMDLGRALENRADARAALGQLVEALSDLDRALGIHEALLTADREDASLRARVAWDLRRGAEIWLESGRAPREARRRLERATELLEKNLTLDPTTTFDRLNRARCLSTLAQLEEGEAARSTSARAGKASQSEGASGHHAAALAAWRELAADGILPPSERGRLERLEAAAR